MSRIGKLPIVIPPGITVKKDGQTLEATSAKGALKLKLHPNMKITLSEKEIRVERPDDEKENRSLHGLSRTLIANMMEGLEKGFVKRLEIRGVGYRAKMEGKNLSLSLGFSHPVIFPTPEGITVQLDEEKKNFLIVSGIDKQLVGQAAANIRAFKKPEPYKGKGIRYENEHVPQKAGKTAASSKS